MSSLIKKLAVTGATAGVLLAGTTLATDTAAHAATHCLAVTNYLTDFGCTVVSGNGAPGTTRAY